MMFTRTSVICFGLLVFCVPVAAIESDQEAEPAGQVSTDTGPPGEKSDVKGEDILDRVFSPLDNAVSDINRDINESGDKAAPDSSE